MPDGTQVIDRTLHHHRDSLSAAPDFPRMDYASASRAPPPPGIASRGPSVSRSVATPGAIAASAPHASHSSPSSSRATQATLAAPRPMQPYPRLTSPQPYAEPGATPSSSGARSPSPTKRSFNFPMGDPSERWNSIGQVSGSGNRGSTNTTTSQRKPSIHAGLSASSAAAEPFLGYNELFSPNGSSSLATLDATKSANAAALSTSDPMNVAFRSGSSNDSRAGFALSSSQEHDLVSHRFGLSPGHYAAGGRDDVSSHIGGNPRSAGHDDFLARSPFGPGAGPAMLGMPNPGNLSPRSMMQLQHQHMQMQSQLHMQAQQQQQQQQSSQQSQFAPSQQLGMQAGVGNAAGTTAPGGPPEEITTVFIVGFPDDMTEREFANMFLFAKGFEASTLKIPAGIGVIGPNGRLSDGTGPLSAGPGGPYQAVNLQGSGVFDLGGNAGPAWDEPNMPLGVGRGGASDTFTSLANMTGMPNALGAPGLGAAGVANSAAAAAAAGKIKQIIGFAKFRTRADALEARDALNGRKVDADKGCVLKTEMAKKNLHTKQRPVLTTPGFAEGPNVGMPPPSSMGAGATSGQAPAMPPFALATPFDPRAGPQMNGPGSQGGPFGPFAKGPGSFEPFNGPAPTSNDLVSPHEMFGGPDFFAQGGPGRPAPSSQQAQSQPQQTQSQQPSSTDKWGGSLGPLDYYGPESGTTSTSTSSRGVQSGVTQTFNAQNAPRSEWPPVGSPPPGLYSAAAGGSMAAAAAAAAAAQQRPAFQRQGSRGTSVGAIGPEQPAASAVKKPEEGIHSAPQSTSPDTALAASEAQASSAATRFGALNLGSPPADDDGAKPPPQVPSPDQSSTTGGRNVVGDNHPPVNTLFVGNLPSNASSAVLSQIEDQLRGVFGSCRGYRQISFRLKSNGPMCFVEFEDVHTASKAMSELNGHSLGGSIKNGGIRLSFSKNPLFRMNSNSAINGAVVGGSGSSTGTLPSPDSGAVGSHAPLSLGSASESLSSAAVTGARR